MNKATIFYRIITVSYTHLDVYKRQTWFLKVIIGIVLSVGLLISVLSFYILMLSIYLLLQKNTSKLENLLLIGYSPAKVALCLLYTSRCV